MMHKAWSSIEELPYCFSRSSVKFQGHTALKIVEFDPNWPFPDPDSSLNTPLATIWCTKLEIALKRCPIVFQGHPSNFKVPRYKTSPILTQIGRFRTIGRSQLSNPSDLPCLKILIKVQNTSVGSMHLNLTSWCHNMENRSVLAVHCEGKPSVDSSHKTPVIGSFDIFFDGELNKLLQK